MNVTLDRNVYGRVATATDIIQDNLTSSDFERIRYYIRSGSISTYISEASLALEALSKDQRIHEFFRQWANHPTKINLPVPPDVDIDRTNKILSIGIKILHSPRLILGSFHTMRPEHWAEDKQFSKSERLRRQSNFIRGLPADGLKRLRDFGKHLAAQYKLNQNSWLKGIVTAFDRQEKKHLDEIDQLIREWCDEDIIASHYAYGFDLLCTNDNPTSNNRIFSQHSRNVLKDRFNVEIVSTKDLIQKIGIH